MRDSQLSNLEAFVAVATDRSFSRAARSLGVTASAVSQAVKRLEERVGAPLFARTTRSVHLTEAGDRLLERAGPALRIATQALDELPVHGRGVAGMLKLNVPRIGVATVMAAMPRFLSENPDASAEVVVEDSLVDIVARGFDAGVRLHESLADGMMATRIAKGFRFVLVASPAYLKKHGRPTSIADLARHERIAMRLPSGPLYRWELQESGRELAAPAGGRLVVSGVAPALEAARLGLGIAYADEASAAGPLARKEVELVLESAAVKVPGLFLYYPASMKREPKIRAFLQACGQSAKRAGG